MLRPKGRADGRKDSVKTVYPQTQFAEGGCIIKKQELHCAGQYTPIGVTSTKHYTIQTKQLKSLLCTSTDNQNWIFNTKVQHSVGTESRVMVRFPRKNDGGVTILLLCTFTDDALYFYQVL